jgi:hypothetical protein
MPYWNRDLSVPPAKESFKAWCDGCFPLYRPTTAETFGPFGLGTTREEHAAWVFGGQHTGSLVLGIEHMIDLALTSHYYAEAIERYLTDETRWTPTGYAWAPWRMGVNCEVCGRPI